MYIVPLTVLAPRPVQRTAPVIPSIRPAELAQDKRARRAERVWNLLEALAFAGALAGPGGPITAQRFFRIREEDRRRQAER
jgi:hypothetical protein